MEQIEYYQIRLQKLHQAVQGLAEAMKFHSEDFNLALGDLVRCGHVQKFEYCIELLWKTIKVWLEIQEITDVNSPKEVIKSFYQTTKISDELYQSLLLALHHRNLYSHVYGEDEFIKLYQDIPKHVTTMKTVVSILQDAYA